MRSMSYSELLRAHKKETDPKRKSYYASRLWQIRNPEKVAEYNKRKRAKVSPEKKRAYRAAWLKRRYGGGEIRTSSNTKKRLSLLKNSPI